MSFSASNKPEYVNLKSIFGDNNNASRTSKHVKRRAPLPPNNNNNNNNNNNGSLKPSENVRQPSESSFRDTPKKIVDKNDGKEMNAKLQIMEDGLGGGGSSAVNEKDFDLNSQLKELENIAKCYNNLKIKIERSTNPFEEDGNDYDENKNPFYESKVVKMEEEEEFDEKNPFRSKTMVEEFNGRNNNASDKYILGRSEVNEGNKHNSEIILKTDAEQNGVELRKNSTPSKIPKRTLSVNSGENAAKKENFQRNGDIRHSVGPGTKDTPKVRKDRFLRATSDDNRDALETFKKPWTRVSAKFKREPLNIANKGPGRGNNNNNNNSSNNRPTYRKNVTNVQCKCQILNTPSLEEKEKEDRRRISVLKQQQQQQQKNCFIVRGGELLGPFVPVTHATLVELPYLKP
ncbi:conserved hypothetical protein [Pediculus humanus corporis]|uniref:Uncharacterized protein n=1 Tax=Pediculus humanus subsp. corporis TaxID=121224 RepID=E0VY43_PEDHC|nr:uncharacterized protein Phum_PHUM509240 [Pediculus humanus corporis]EEB18299.1 conserved hypothetical protein [Pediculus humanus corporis]